MLTTGKPARRERRKSDSIPEYLTEEEMGRLLAVITDVRDRAIFTVQYFRGLRASEMGRLDVRDYQAATGRLTVRRRKGSRGGEYLLLPVERAALKAWLKKRGAAPGPLFVSRRRRPIGRVQIFRLMRRYCLAAGIAVEKSHPHALKHSCAMHLSAREPDIVAIQDHLGHADIRNTMKYVRITSRRRQDFAQKLEGGGWGAAPRK